MDRLECGTSDLPLLAAPPSHCACRANPRPCSYVFPTSSPTCSSSLFNFSVLPHLPPLHCIKDFASWCVQAARHRAPPPRPQLSWPIPCYASSIPLQLHPLPADRALLHCINHRGLCDVCCKPPYTPSFRHQSPSFAQLWHLVSLFDPTPTQQIYIEWYCSHSTVCTHVRQSAIVS